MIKNYLKITLRNILKHKGYSFINITGLATGIACCLLIFIYVKGELTYDQFHENKDRIFRVTSKINFAGRESVLGASGYPEGQAYKDDVPEIETVVRVNNETAVVRKGDEYLQQNRIIYADPDIFEVFDFKLLHGGFDRALDELNQVVISRDMAIKYFGKTDVVGETLEMNVYQEMESFYVTAVIENHPTNSSFNFDMVLPWEKHLTQMNEYRKNSWGNISLNTFVMLTKGADPVAVEEKIAAVRTARNPGDDKEFERGIVNGLQPLTDIHLNTELRGGDGLGISGDPVYAYILSGIALIILIVACINFTNLSMARSLPRAREIGVRKVLGAHKKQLAYQFLGEALVMCIIAFVMGLIMAELSLPVFGQLTERVFQEGIVDDGLLMLMCLVLVLLTTVLSGFYPAFIISRFKTINSLKGRVRLKGNSAISKVLVIVQFTIAAVLVIGTITMNRQMSHMVEMDLGYDDQNLLSVDADGTQVEGLDRLIKGELAKDPNIIDVSVADDYGSYTGAEWGENNMLVCFNEIDDRYFDLMGLQMVQGRKLKKNVDRYISPEGDTLTNIIVNETYLEQTGEDSILYKVTGRYRIVGIVKDYHYKNVKGAIEPLMMMAASENRSGALANILVKYRPEYLPQIKSVVGNAWSKFAPSRPYDASFVAEANANRYEDDARWQSIVTYATFLAIIISILGLFGLAHLTTQQRTKEVGIRKVLGASLGQIVLMLNSTFAKLVLISVVVASPLAYYFIDKWLQNFAYPVDITVMLFVIPGIITFSIAFITVSVQSVKQARSNPVDSLRYE